MFTKFKQFVAAVLVGVTGLFASVPAMADGGVPDGTATLTSLTTSQSLYSVPMYALAAAAVGIMIAVKWIKRGRGAA